MNTKERGKGTLPVVLFVSRKKKCLCFVLPVFCFLFFVFFVYVFSTSCSIPVLTVACVIGGENEKKRRKDQLWNNNNDRFYIKSEIPQLQAQIKGKTTRSTQSRHFFFKIFYSSNPQTEFEQQKKNKNKKHSTTTERK